MNLRVIFHYFADNLKIDWESTEGIENIPTLQAALVLGTNP